MGIRFLCPNGHKLNVKSFLAGKRGLCPQCDAKFLVPEVSGGQAEHIVAGAEDTEAAGSGGPSDHGDPETPQPLMTEAPLSETPVPPPMPVEAVAATQVTEQAPTEVWYVRSTTGEQFGPASTDVMQSWVTEGRVPVDSWVWRTGWPEWKTGDQAIAFLNGPPAIPPSAMPPSAMPPSAMPVSAAAIPDLPEAAPQPDVPIENAVEPIPEAVAPTTTYRTSRRSRQERARKVTFFLGAVVLLLIVVLVIVLIKNNS